MNYTKGEWSVHELNRDSNSIPSPLAELIPSPINTKIQVVALDAFSKLKPNERDYEVSRANAKLIAAAVNGCIKTNPDNPIAVAESVKDMYEACYTFGTALAIWQKDPSKSPITLVTIFNETIGKALAKAEGKQ